MARKKWCIAPSHPLVVQIAEKYRISKRDARTILDSTFRKNPALQTEDMTLAFLENQDEFKEGLQVYAEGILEQDDAVFKRHYVRKEEVDAFRAEMEKYGDEITEEQAAEILQSRTEFETLAKLNKNSSRQLFHILNTIKDPRHLDFIGKWVAKYYSDLLTTIQLDPSLRKQFGIKKPKDKSRKGYLVDTNCGAAEILRKKTLGRLALSRKALAEEGDAERALILDTIMKNFNTILYLYGAELFRAEGVSVTPEGTFRDPFADPAGVESNDIDENDESDEDTSESSTSQFSSSDRNQPVSSKIVPHIKALLSCIRDTDSKGNFKSDPYGFKLHSYLEMPAVVNKLLSLCKGYDKLSDMVKSMKSSVKAIPWIQQVLNAIDSNNDSDTGKKKRTKSQKEQLGSMFFKSFRKQFTRFRESFLTYDEDGIPTMETRDANVNHREDRMMAKVRSAFRSRTNLPIFTDRKINFKYISSLKNYVSNKTTGLISKLTPATEKARQIAQDASNLGKDLNFDEAYQLLNQVKYETRQVLAALGINASERLLEEYLCGKPTDPKVFYGSSVRFGDPILATQVMRLQSLMSNINTALSELVTWGRAIDEHKITSDTAETSPFDLRRKTRSNYPEINKIRRAFKMLISKLTEFSPDAFDSMFRMNGKNIYSWNNPSSIQTIIEKLKNKDLESVQDYIMKKYGVDIAWFLKDNSTPDEPHFYAQWLEDLYYGNGSEVIEYSEKPSICGKEYENTSDLAYGLSILMDFFAGDLDGKTAWYRMLIASDKPRYSSVQNKRYSYVSKDEEDQEEDFHNIIVRQAIDFFAQELKRSRNVVRFAALGEGTKIKGYDLKPTKETEEEYNRIMKKVRNGEQVYISDVIKDGRYIFRDTGASFYLNKFVIDEIEKGTKIGKYAIDLIFNPINKTNIEWVDSTITGAFKTAFHKYMKSIKDNYLNRMKKAGLFAIKNVKGKKHAKFLLGILRQKHANERRDLFEKGMLSKQMVGIGAKFLSVSDIKEDMVPYIGEVGQFYVDMDEFIYNNWMAKANMSQIFDVDLAFYGTTTNFQKRNAQIISSGYTPDTEAKIHDNPVSDGKYRSMTIKTTKIFSSVYPNIKKALEDAEQNETDPKKKRQLKKAIKYTLSQIEKFDATDGQALVGLTAFRKRQAGLGEWTRSDNPTDDRLGYITNPETNKKIRVSTDEAVYQRMRRGEFNTDDLLHVFGQPQKPFVFAFINVRRGDRTVTVPVQNKNSEYLLAFLSAFSQAAAPESQLAAVARFMEETAKDNKGLTGIDTINFDSAVKIGDNSESVDLGNMTAQETYDTLMTAAYGTNQTEGTRTYRDGAVLEYDIQDYKIVQEKPEHFRHGAKQPMGSQMKILSINNIHDDEKITMPDGSIISGKELRTRYFNALREKLNESEKNLRESFGLSLPRSRRLHKLSNVIKRAMASDQKFTSEMRAALSLVNRNGEDQFAIPLDEPGIQSAVESMILSKIRKAYYKDATFGGIVVQAASWGMGGEFNLLKRDKFAEKHKIKDERKLDEEYHKYVEKAVEQDIKEGLHIRFYSSNKSDPNGILLTKAEFAHRENIYDAERLDAEYDKYVNEYQKGYAYFECELPMPDHVQEMLLDKSGKIDKRFINDDGSWNMNAIQEVVPEGALDAICYRTPTEAKYSIMVCKIKRFSPNKPGSVAKYPAELTVFTGSDFDIDTDFIEIRPPKGWKNEKWDNILFDLQFAALRSTSGLQETFKPGDFSDLSELSYYITLYRAGYSLKQLDKMSFGELKDKCEQVENLDLMDPYTDVILHNQNSDAGKMIAIAAVGVTSHAFFSLYNDINKNNPERDPAQHPENFVRIRIKKGSNKTRYESFTVVNDKEDPKNPISRDFEGFVILDPLYDMDGKLISTEISKYVGASADAAKDAAEYRLGITEETMPTVILMHRLGISSDIARLFVGQDVIRDFVVAKRINSAFSDNGKFDSLLRNQIDSLADKYGITTEEVRDAWERISHQRNSLVYSELLQNSRQTITEKNKQSMLEYDLKLLNIYKTLHDLGNTIRNLDSFVRYNSSKAMSGTSYITRSTKRLGLDTLATSLDQDESRRRISLPKDVQILPEFKHLNEFGRLCSMFPYIARTIIGESEMFEKIILENMHTYGHAFQSILDRLGINNDEELVKLVYSNWKSYLLFVGPGRIANFSNPYLMSQYTRGFADHYDKKMAKLRNNKDFYNRVIAPNTFLNSISRVSAKEHYGNFDILKTDVAGITSANTERYEKDWAALLEFPETRELAIDLAIHFLAQSAAFNRNAPITLIPMSVKQAIPGYIEAFADADKIQFSDKDLELFLHLLGRNNAENRKLVPRYENNEERKVVDVKFGKNKDGLVVASLIFGARSGFSSHVLVTEVVKETDDGKNETENKLIADRNIIAVDNTLFYITDIKLTGSDQERTLTAAAIPVSPMGIPNQISEFTSAVTQTSLYLDAGQKIPLDSISNEYLSIEEMYAEPEDDSPTPIRQGTRIGSFVMSEPYGSEELDADLETALPDMSFNTPRNTYLEGRTHLNRAMRLAEILGLDIGAIQRGISGKTKNPSYILNIKPTEKLDKSLHERALDAAALIGELGFTESNPTVKTYVDSETFDGFEISIPLKAVEDINDVLKIARKRFKTGVTYNESRSELSIFVPMSDTLDIPDASPIVTQAVDQAIAVRDELVSIGAADSNSVLESNFVKYTSLTNRDKKTKLNKLRDDSRIEQRAEDEEKATAGTTSQQLGDEDENQVRVGDLAELALRRQAGEDVSSEIRQIFGERLMPYADPVVSYESYKLKEAILPAMSTDLLDAVEAVIDEKQSARRTPASMVDSMIINVANWIIGNRKGDNLNKLLTNTGLSDENAANIINVIENKLKELNIC